MASGITHILLMKGIQYQLEEGALKSILQSAIYYQQAGAVGPDLPYASVADDDFFLSTDSILADLFHYEQTNRLILRAFEEVKALPEHLTARDKRYVFAFFLGYASHIIADGIIHPYVRDMVGNYKENKTAHRVLEMNLDVVFFHFLTVSSGSPIELNYSNIHDELENFDGNSEAGKAILDILSRLIREVYDKDIIPDEIRGWIEGLHRMFAIAEGTHPMIYRIPVADRGYVFANYEDLEHDIDSIVLLTRPRDREDNFMKQEKVHFLDDCVPQFYRKFIPLAEKAYQYVYHSGPALKEEDIPLIDLDTGRALAVNNDLDVVPELWRIA